MSAAKDASAGSALFGAIAAEFTSLVRDPHLTLRGVMPVCYLHCDCCMSLVPCCPIERVARRLLVKDRLLFPIDSIDLNGVAKSAEEVSEINPQCGDMRQLDYVIWMAEDASQGLGVKQVRDDEFWVPGHIPGRPLLPGVLMIEAAAQLSSVLYHCKVDEPRFVGFTRCNDVAFRGQVVPGDTMYLLAKEVSFKKRRFICDTQAVVGDKLVFEGQITGMVL